MSSRLFFRRKPPELDNAVAEQMLSHVFDVCGYAHNTVPLDVLISYSNYRKERFAMQRGFIIIVLVLFVFLPFLFVASTLTLNAHGNGVNDNPVYNISVSTKIPVSQVEAVIDGKHIPVQEIASHEYLIQPDLNGEMIISARLLNNQVTTMKVTVETVDVSPPVLLYYDFTDEFFFMYIKDEGSGVDFASVYAEDEAGIRLENVYGDEENERVVLPYPRSVTNVYITDKKGNSQCFLLRPSTPLDSE